MKRKKNKNWLVICLIFALVVILGVLINFSNSNGGDTKLNLTEKKWIENNKKDVINVSIANNIPGFSSEGEGVFFDFISKLEEKTELSFNLISYDASEDTIENDLYFEVVKKDDVNKLTDNDMVFYKDYYVLVSKTKGKVSDPSDIINKKIGVLNNDLSNVSYFLPNNNSITYVTYQNDSEVKNALKNDSVDYIAIPKTRYASYIMSNKYHVIYNITELKEAYVLKTSSSINKNLKNIVRKNYIEYKNNDLEKEYNNSLINLILEENNISEKTKADFLSKKYVFGYLQNDPYTNDVNGKLIGLDSTFINSFAKLSGASFTFKKYNSVRELTNDINKGKVDVAPYYYNYSSLSGKYAKTISPYDEEYVVLVYNSRVDIVVNSIKSLNNKEVITTNSTLAKFLEKNANAKVKKYDRVSQVISNINKKSIIVLDKNIYEMYKDGKLSDYRVIYNDKENLEYGYMIRDVNENTTFKNLFTTYMEMSNYKQLNNVAWKNFKTDSKEISHNYLYVI